MRRIWPAILLLGVPVMAWAVITGSNHPGRLDRREQQLSRGLMRASQFVNVFHVSARAACQDVQPPEELTTPDPMFIAGGHKVKVSFIIGIDGRVHSPLILVSAGLAGDRHVLRTVRTWRYRPAKCNGVPTETEGKVEFSNQ